jgi:hypothetical protein
VSVIEADGDTDDGNEELADEHTKSAVDQERAATEFLDCVEGDWGAAHVDEGEDERDQEGVLDSASRLKEWSGVVEDEVNTSPKDLLVQFMQATKLVLFELTIAASFVEMFPELCGASSTSAPRGNPRNSWPTCQ